MYKKILLAYDGSEAGQKALLSSGDLAQWSQSELSLIAVMPSSLNVMSVEGASYDGELLEIEKRQYQAVLNEGVARLAALGHAVSGQLLNGDPVDQIARHARTIGADLIVVGHKHLDSWAARWWSGSISKALVEHAPCSVLVVIVR
ncbi:MAG: universal stress protein [Burkholderiaceae bacterium]|nr:universal stress protein [Burkholderiaceae bacterium]MDO9089150.1 universal stress protein [Burkholderiaceae bacterium]